MSRDPEELRKDLARLDRLAEELPFALDDAKAVGACFRRSTRFLPGQSTRQVAVWTYCFIRRYFVVRFLAAVVDGTGADLEYLIERAYRKVERGRDKVKDPLRYSHWVGVICRNTWRNHRSRFRSHTPLVLVAEPRVREPDAMDYHDRAVQHRILTECIAQLPAAVGRVAKMRLLSGMEYATIAEVLGLPVATIRSYMHKAVKALRAQDLLLTALGQEIPSSTIVQPRAERPPQPYRERRRDSM